MPDQAAIRIDFPTWLGNLYARDRRVALKLVERHRTIDVARRFGKAAASLYSALPPVEVGFRKRKHQTGGTRNT